MKYENPNNKKSSNIDIWLKKCVHLKESNDMISY